MIGFAPAAGLRSNAVETNNEIGVGFFAYNGDLLSVEVDVSVNKAKVSFSVDETKKKNKSTA